MNSDNLDFQKELPLKNPKMQNLVGGLALKGLLKLEELLVNHQNLNKTIENDLYHYTKNQ